MLIKILEKSLYIKGFIVEWSCLLVEEVSLYKLGEDQAFLNYINSLDF